MNISTTDFTAHNAVDLSLIGYNARRNLISKGDAQQLAKWGMPMGENHIALGKRPKGRAPLIAVDGSTAGFNLAAEWDGSQPTFSFNLTFKGLIAGPYAPWKEQALWEISVRRTFLAPVNASETFAVSTLLELHAFVRVVAARAVVAWMQYRAEANTDERGGVTI